MMFPVEAITFVGPALKQKRMATAKLYQREVAEIMSRLLKEDISQGYISQVETGQLVIPNDRFIAYCNAVKVNPCEIFSDALHLYRTNTKKNLQKVVRGN